MSIPNVEHRSRDYRFSIANANGSKRKPRQTSTRKRPPRQRLRSNALGFADPIGRPAGAWNCQAVTNASETALWEIAPGWSPRSCQIAGQNSHHTGNSAARSRRALILTPMPWTWGPLWGRRLVPLPDADAGASAPARAPPHTTPTLCVKARPSLRAACRRESP